MLVYEGILYKVKKKNSAMIIRVHFISSLMIWNNMDSFHSCGNSSFVPNKYNEFMYL